MRERKCDACGVIIPKGDGNDLYYRISKAHTGRYEIDKVSSDEAKEHGHELCDPCLVKFQETMQLSMKYFTEMTKPPF